MSRARRAEVGITYENEDITQEIRQYCKLFSYTDVASGNSDSISLTLADRDRKWLKGWAPKKGDHLSAEARFYDWEKEGDHWGTYCGEFEVDDIGQSGPPAVCEVNAVSIPRSEAFNDEDRTKTWEDVTVSEIAEEIAGRAGIEVVYQAEDIPIKSLEQDKQPDCKFLYSVCETYGLAMKVFANKIIIFDESVYEASPPVTTLHYEDFLNYRYNSTVADTYTGAAISYSDPVTGEDHIVTVGGGSRIKEINREADSAADAERKAVAALNNANKKSITLTGTVKARRQLIASCCVTVAGFGTPDGIYYLDKVVTKISANGASQQTLTMHRTGYRMEDAQVVIDERTEPEEEGEGSSYIVAKGDTLGKIATTCLGDRLRYAEIYILNQETIETEARSRGKKDSSNGHWIFPGTELKIPPAEKGGAADGQ